jgi:hypothetical protein
VRLKVFFAGCDDFGSAMQFDHDAVPEVLPDARVDPERVRGRQVVRVECSKNGARGG